MKKTLVTALLLAACAFIISLVYKPLPIPSLIGQDRNGETRSIEISGRMVQAEIADTPAEREKGLSGREELAPGEGMLFVFPEDGVYSFWMKDMRFAIDILWISREGVIVDVRENVSPESYPAAFTPRGEARYAVELPAGYAEEYSVRPGDAVRL